MTKKRKKQKKSPEKKRQKPARPESLLSISSPGSLTGSRASEEMLAHLGRLLDSQGPDFLSEGSFLQNPEKLNRLLNKELDKPKDTSPLAQAQELMYRAAESRSSADRIWSARAALKLSPDCVDAYTMLADENCSTPQTAIEQYKLAIKAGKRVLGAGDVQKAQGAFLGVS